MSVTLYMYGSEREVYFHKFPAGEIGCALSEEVLHSIAQWGKKSSCTINMLFQENDDIFKVLCLADALKEVQPAMKLHLNVPYFPAARADRCMCEGDAFGLRVYVNVLTTVSWESVRVVDPHSSVLAGMFPPGVLKVSNLQDIWTRENLFDGKSPDKFVLIAPDQGAYKKVSNLAEKLDVPMITCQKVRHHSSRGDFINIDVDEKRIEELHQRGFDHFVVVDDICDGGGTFVALAKTVGNSVQNLHLRVTHGIFSKGLDCLYDYDTIRCQYYLGNDQEIGQDVTIKNN